jgi:hypothetical protein
LTVARWCIAPKKFGIEMIYLQNVDVIERAKVAKRNNVISTSHAKPHLQAQFMDYSDGQCTSPTR